MRGISFRATETGGRDLDGDPVVTSSLCSEWLCFLESEGIKPRTRTSYLSAVRHWLRFLLIKGIRYDDVGFQVATNWKVWMMRDHQMKPRALNSALSAVRSFYRWLRISNYIHGDPLQDIRCVKAPRLLPKPISEEWVEKIIAAAETPCDRALLETLYASGGRIGEMESMRLGGLDLANGLIRVMGKGDKERFVQIGSKAIAAIEEWIAFRRRRYEELRADTPLWIGCRWLKMDKKTMRAHLRDCAKRAGFPERIWPHRFRHSFCTHLLDHGADLREVQELAGHDNIVSTQIYTEVSTKRLRGAFIKAHPRA